MVDPKNARHKINIAKYGRVDCLTSSEYYIQLISRLPNILHMTHKYLTEFNMKIQILYVYICMHFSG